jgi:hypothetical protein
MMSVVNEADLLDTIKNRAAIFRMRPYSLAEKREYLDSLGTRLDADTESFILDLSNSLHNIDMLLKFDVREFESYVVKLIDSFSKDSPARLLNSIKQIAFKDDSDGYDLNIFFKMCLTELSERVKSGKDEIVYGKMMKRTMEAMSDLRYSSVSKEKTFDMWILDCRKIAKKYGDKSGKTADTK